MTNTPNQPTTESLEEILKDYIERYIDGDYTSHKGTKTKILNLFSSLISKAMGEMENEETSNEAINIVHNVRNILRKEFKENLKNMGIDL